MALKLNKKAFDFAKRLVNQGKVVHDQRGDWSREKPSTNDENAYLRSYGANEYGNWFLGVDEEKPADTKERYEFPYGDFDKVYRAGLVAAETRAAQYKHHDIQQAAKQLIEMIDDDRR